MDIIGLDVSENCIGVGIIDEGGNYVKSYTLNDIAPFKDGDIRGRIKSVIDDIKDKDAVFVKERRCNELMYLSDYIVKFILHQTADGTPVYIRIKDIENYIVEENGRFKMPMVNDDDHVFNGIIEDENEAYALGAAYVHWLMLQEI